MLRRPPRSTSTDTRFPYTTRFRSWVILPCELVVNNGNVLREMVLKLAERNGFGPAFTNWISDHNRFCNTIVDRIIPGKPDAGQQQNTFDHLGYKDQRSEEHTSELQSLMRISYAVFCLKKKKT